MISNRQRAVPVPMRGVKQFFARAMREVHLPPRAAAVSFVTSARIAKWNRLYRGKDKPTDVLSFPAGDEMFAKAKRRPSPRRSANRSSAPSACYLGDIAIAPAVARRNARLCGRTFDQELRILILHGILHLMGYDHEADTGRMDRREKRLRRKLGIAWP